MATQTRIVAEPNGDQVQLGFTYDDVTRQILTVFLVNQGPPGTLVYKVSQGVTVVLQGTVAVGTVNESHDVSGTNTFLVQGTVRGQPDLTLPWTIEAGWR